MHRSPLLARLALIPLGLVITVIGLELVLQLGALAVRATGLEAPTGWKTRARRVLCVGDSNTFGLWMKDRDQESYPGRLEALWNESSPSSPIEVLNLGFPGINSSVVRRDLPHMLESLEPQIVIAMIGTNDPWTEPVAAETLDEPGRGDLAALLRRHSRVYRGLFMLHRQLNPEEIEIELVEHDRSGWSAVARFGGEEFQLGFTRGPADGVFARTSLRANLRAVVEQAAASRVELILMTYPARVSFYAPANKAIREVAAETGTPLIDLEAIFKPLCPKQECPDWLLADSHPTARGYGLIAKTIAKRLAADDR